MDIAAGFYSFIFNRHFSSLAFGALLLGFALMLYRRQSIPIPTYGRRLFLWYFVIALVTVAAVAASAWVSWHDLKACGTACRYEFPPYSNYYLNETFIRWSSTLAFNAVVGLVGGIIFSVVARATKGRIIDQLDVDLLTVGGMIAGWPNILLFYGLVFVLTTFTTVVRAVQQRAATVRMIITPVLPLAAALIALYGDVIARFFHMYEIGVTLF